MGLDNIHTDKETFTPSLPLSPIYVLLHAYIIKKQRNPVHIHRGQLFSIVWRVKFGMNINITKWTLIIREHIAHENHK